MKFINVIKANKYISELETAAVDTQKKLADAEAMVINLQNMSKDMTEAQAEHENVITQLKAEYEAKIEAINKQTDVVALSTANKAADIVASIGVEPETIKASVVPTPKEILTTFQKLTGEVAANYYAKNKDTIVKELGLNK